MVHFYGQCISEKTNFGPVVLWSSLQQIPLLGHVESCCERNRWLFVKSDKIILFQKTQWSYGPPLRAVHFGKKLNLVLWSPLKSRL